MTGSSVCLANFIHINKLGFFFLDYTLNSKNAAMFPEIIPRLLT